MIAESTKKTDRLDAQVLTEFLVLDMIPESYQPTPRQRQHRALVRHRQYLQGRITSVRSKIRHILSNYNADRKDLFSANCGPAYLKEVRLSDVDRLEIQQLWAEWQDHLAQRLAIIIPATKIRTNPYSRFGPATADRGSRGIRDQPRNPPKYTEKRIRITFPCPSRGATPARRVGSFHGYPFVMIFLAGVDDGSSDNWQEVGQDVDSGPDHNPVAGRPVPEKEGRARPNRTKSR